MHVARVTVVCWSPDSSMIATGALDTNIVVAKVTDLDNTKVVVKGMRLNFVFIMHTMNKYISTFTWLCSCITCS